MTGAIRIVLATPHQRYDVLESELRAVGGFEVLRIRSREELTVAGLERFDPAYVFFPHWSWRIPDEILSSRECVIFHMTDLPYGRGGSPLQNLIVRKVEVTQLSALRCSTEIDAGPVYLKMPLSTLGSAEEVFLRAAKLMLPMIVRIAREKIQPRTQIGDPVTFDRRRPEQGNLIDAPDLTGVHDLIRMLDAEGYPQAFVEVGPLRMTFTRASLKPDSVVADVRIEWRDQGKRN